MSSEQEQYINNEVSRDWPYGYIVALRFEANPEDRWWTRLVRAIGVIPKFYIFGKPVSYEEAEQLKNEMLTRFQEEGRGGDVLIEPYYPEYLLR